MEASHSEKNTSNAVSVKRNIKLVVNINDMGRIKEISQLLTPEARVKFSRKYGKILDLLLITVDTQALSALGQFWNTSLRCFELPHLDVTPTIEEYARMLDLPVYGNSSVYLYHGHYVSEDKLAPLMEIQAQNLSREIRGSTHGLKRSFLESYLQALALQGRWEVFSRVLALTIYGLVLFPFVPNMVDQAAMDVFYWYETRKANPVPAILAETFLSFEVCHQKKGGKLRCCSHLLYVWIMTHVYAGSHLKPSASPLRSFYLIPIKKMEIYEWGNELGMIKPDAFKWVCPWYNEEEVIISCGSFSSVPLMGPRGCITYTPFVVLRQLCYTQDVPPEHFLGGLCSVYQKDVTSIKWVTEVKNAWSNISVQGKKDLGKRIVAHTDSYQAWRETRRAHHPIPSTVKRNENSNETQAQAQMMAHVEQLKAQMEVMNQKRQAAECEILTLENKCLKLSKEIEYLKDENADLAEASTRGKKMRRGKEKETDTVLVRVHELEMKVRTQDELLVKIHKEKKMLELNATRFKNLEKTLEGRIRDLQANLTRSEDDNAQGWLTMQQLHDRLSESFNNEDAWKEQAAKEECEKEKWKDHYEDIMNELSFHVPEFINRFEKADCRVQVDPRLNLPPELSEFMELCGRLTKSLRKRKNKLLM